jgi:hypothetical protein
MKSVVPAVAAACAFAIPSAIAHAQPGAIEPTPPPPLATSRAQLDTVDENVAVGLSLGGTVLSWGLLIAGGSLGNETMSTVGAIGTMFAPSLGHWYSHSVLTRGLGIRALALGIGAVGFAMAIDDFFDEDRDDEGTASALLLIAAGMYIAGTVDDIANAGAAARRYNARLEVSVVPQVSTRGGGLALVGRF